MLKLLRNKSISTLRSNVILRWVFIISLIFTTNLALANRDPTMPPNWNSQAQTGNIPENIALSGIFVVKNEAMAVINGKSMHVGDYIEGYEVTRISRTAVYLKNNRGAFMIPLIPTVKTPVAASQ